MKVSYFLRDNGACGYYRVDLPLRTVKKNSDLEVFRVEKGDTATVIEKALTADVVVIPRISDPNMIKVMENLQAQGKKVVIDHDDNMFEISPFSPHYEEFGIDNVQVAHGEELIPLWEDGKNIDLTVNRARIDAIKEAVSKADMVTVTTEKLADVYREFSSNVWVLPNCLDTKLWQKLPLKKASEDEVRLFWAGGSSHYQDWLILQDVLPVVMNKYPQAKLVLMGTKFDGTLKDINPEQIEFHPWVPTPAYPYKVSILNPDIGIIPLEGNKFNEGKSAIKWIELSSLAVPSVTSLVSPYKEVYDGTNGVFVNGNDPKGWIDGLSTLIEDRLLRAKIGGNAQRTVEQYYDINTQYKQWVDAYKELVNGDERSD